MASPRLRMRRSGVDCDSKREGSRDDFRMTLTLGITSENGAWFQAAMADALRRGCVRQSVEQDDRSRWLRLGRADQPRRTQSGRYATQGLPRGGPAFDVGYDSSHLLAIHSRWIKSQPATGDFFWRPATGSLGFDEQEQVGMGVHETESSHGDAEDAEENHVGELCELCASAFQGLPLSL